LTLISQENYSLALENLHKVVDELDANNSEAYNNMGVVFNQLARYKDAISNFDKSIQLQPGYAQAYSNKALSLLNLGMYDKALNQFQKAIQLGCDDSQLQNNLGLTFYRLRQYRDAIASYDKAILSNPSFAGGILQ